MSKVTLNTDIASREKFDFSIRVTARRVIREVLLLEKCPYDVEVSLSVVGDEQIRELNRDFRGIDRVTDVLSFPGISFNTPSVFSAVEEDAPDLFDPETGRLVLGDIVINAGRVKSQAAEYGHSELREFAFLIAHSTLHLCGYDHMTEEEAKDMESRQTRVLNQLGITREV